MAKKRKQGRKSTTQPKPPSSGRGKLTLAPGELTGESGGAEPDRYPIVGIGAPAGGLDSLIKLLEGIPDHPGMALVVVQHLAPDKTSLMPDVLSRHTSMTVCQVEDHQRVAQNVIRLSDADQGRPLSDFAHDFVDNDLVEVARQVLDKLIAVESEIRCRDGRFFVRRAAPFRTDDHRIGGVIMTLMDITEHQRLDDFIRLSTEEAPVASVMIDQGGEIVLVNRQTEKLFGYRRDELMRRAVETLIPEGFHAQHVNDRSAYLTAPEARPMGAGRNRYGLRKDGSEFPVEVALSPVHTPQGLHVLAMIADITLRKEFEQEIHALNESLQEQIAARAEADSRKDQFLAMLSHELRNPLAPILNAVQVMGKEGEDRENQQTARRVIERQVRHLKRLLDDLLNISRIATGRIRLQTARINLNDVIEHAIERVRPVVKGRKQELVLSTPETPI